MKKFRECGNRHAGMEGQKEGSYMVARNLHSIKLALDEIIPLVDEHDEIESWIEHKISVAKEAISAVHDALVYDQDHNGCGCGGESSPEEEVDIQIMPAASAAHDDFGLGKMMGMLGQNESKYFVGSGSINENRQLIANNTNKKIIVESMKIAGNLIRVKTKSGKEYEYMPHFGAELEVLRCEDYGIKIKKTK